MGLLYAFWRRQEAPTGSMTIYFRHLESSKKGQIDSFDVARIRVGRLPNNELRFDLQKDREVSGNHAEIYRQGKTFVVEDLESTNGTYVNGRRIDQPTAIADGDTIQFSSRGPKVIFYTTEPVVESMETLNLQAPSVETLVIKADQLAAGLGVGTKTLRRMVVDARTRARSAQAGRVGTTSRFVREFFREASSYSSRGTRLIIISLIILLILISGGFVYINYEIRQEQAREKKETARLAERTKRQQEIIIKQQEELEKARALPVDLKEKGIESQETERGLSVELSHVLFPAGKAEISADGEEKIKAIAGVLKDSGLGRKISIEGHASGEKSIAEKMNQTISEDRAKAVAEALVKYGVARDRITSKGVGSSRPIASNDTFAGRQQNRRVEVIIEK